jgi:hypothetical protein
MFGISFFCMDALKSAFSTPEIGPRFARSASWLEGKSAVFGPFWLISLALTKETRKSARARAMRANEAMEDFNYDRTKIQTTRVEVY